MLILHVWGPSEEGTSWPAWGTSKSCPGAPSSPQVWSMTCCMGHVTHVPRLPWCSGRLCPDSLASAGAQMRSPASSGPRLPTGWGEMGLWPRGSAPTRMMWPLPTRGSCRNYQVSGELGLGQTSWERPSGRHGPPGSLGPWCHLDISVPASVTIKSLTFAGVIVTLRDVTFPGSKSFSQ